MKRSVDLVVIGSGKAGMPPAHRCARAGWRVAMVDRAPFGGTCALRGCSAKKLLLAPTRAADCAQRMRDKALIEGETVVRWAGAMADKRAYIDPIPEARDEGLRQARIEKLEGTARFIDQKTLRVGEDDIEANRFVIATGAKPRPLGIPGEKLITTSDAFLDMDLLPRRIVFIGAGYVSMELAHIAARAGAEVTILEHESRPLVPFEEACVSVLSEATREMGISLELGVEVTAVARGDQGLAVTTRGAQSPFVADMVVHGAGRVPWIDDLNLDRAGIAHGKRGVTVDPYLRSISNPRVYAASDAANTPGPPLSPVAGVEGYTVGVNLLSDTPRAVSYTGVPSVVFSIPPLAGVGLTEAAAREQGLDFQVRHQRTSGWFAARERADKYAAHKILISNHDDQIIGAHLVGDGAEEVINLFGMAMRFQVTASRLKEMIYAFPTKASEIRHMV